MEGSGAGAVHPCLEGPAAPERQQTVTTWGCRPRVDDLPADREKPGLQICGKILATHSN